MAQSFKRRAEETAQDAFSDLPDNPGLQRPVALGDLKGIKWKQDLPPRGGEHHDMVFGRLDRPKMPNGDFVPFDEMIHHLKEHGVQAVAFRIDVQRRYIPEAGMNKKQAMEKYHREVAQTIKKLHNVGIDSFLWIRIWLTKQSDKQAVNQFSLFMNNHPKAAELVRGLAITEHQLKSMATVKERALSVADAINAHPKFPNYLKTRDFIMPGTRNGFEFTGVNQMDNFHAEIEKRVSEFAFAVKAMVPKHDVTPAYKHMKEACAEPDWSVEQRVQWLKSKMNLHELLAYQANSQHPRSNNIVFWGDSGDSMILLHPRFCTALHRVLHGPQHRGQFQYDPCCHEVDDTPKDKAKAILLYRPERHLFEANKQKHGKWKNKGPCDAWAQWCDRPGCDFEQP